jgi:hypothetical protein
MHGKGGLRLITIDPAAPSMMGSWRAGCCRGRARRRGPTPAAARGGAGGAGGGMLTCGDVRRYCGEWRDGRIEGPPGGGR